MKAMSRQEIRSSSSAKTLLSSILLDRPLSVEQRKIINSASAAYLSVLVATTRVAGGWGAA